MIRKEYPCAQPGATKGEAIALTRLPAKVNQTQYKAIFRKMQGALIRAAIGAPPHAIPGPTSLPNPTLSGDEGSLLQLSVLDAHVAEMLGLMYIDDDPRAVGPQIYRVVGHYLIPNTFSFSTKLTKPGAQILNEFFATGVQLLGPVSLSATGSVSPGALVRPCALSLDLNQRDLAVTIEVGAPLQWQTLDAAGKVLTAWTQQGVGRATLGALGVASIEFGAGSAFRIVQASWNVPEDNQQFRVINNRDPGPPAPPKWVQATTQSPPGQCGNVQAEVNWQVYGDGLLDLLYNPTQELPLDLPSGNAGAPTFYQACAAQLGTDPSKPAPALPATPPNKSYALGGEPLTQDQQAASLIVVPPSLYSISPRTLAIDAGPASDGIDEGWQAYWVRSVDLFGRASSYTPIIVKVIDESAPPPPQIVAAEYIQAKASPASSTAAARRWIAKYPGQDGVNVALAWTPEMGQQCGGVDGFAFFFQGYSHLPVNDPTWSTTKAYTSIAPQPVTPSGSITSVTYATAKNALSVTISSVTALTPLQLSGAAAPIPLAACATDLTLDAGAGLLVGWALVAADGTAYPIVANGNGDAINITVQCPAGAPGKGKYTLDPGPQPNAPVGTGFLVVATDMTLTPVDSTRLAGVLVITNPANGDQWRFLVVANNGGTFYCRMALPLKLPSGAPNPQVASVFPSDLSLPQAKAPVTWYPVYSVTVASPGAGTFTSMVPSPNQARTFGQVDIRSLRKTGTPDAQVSGPSVPATIRAIDATPPAAPTFSNLIPVAVGDLCEQLAGPADWFGHSTFPAPNKTGLTWTATVGDGLTYNVYRGVDRALWIADWNNSATHDVTKYGQATPTITLVQNALKAGDPKGIAKEVQADFAALDAALAAAASNEDKFAAYAQLHALAQMVLVELQIANASPRVPAAFVLLPNPDASPNGSTPIDPTSQAPNSTPGTGYQYAYTDTLDGKSRAHWFYCVTAVSQTGIEGPPSWPTPPICCPNVVPPRAPILLTAVSSQLDTTKAGTIALKIVGNAEPNITAYNVYQLASTDVAGFDPRNAVPTMVCKPNTDIMALKANNITVAPPPAPGVWTYCVTALDDATPANMSAPSAFVTSKAFPAAPQPLVWVSANRNPAGIQLTWQVATVADSRLSCLVERRPTGSGFWLNISGWLPRGTVTYTDTPPSATAGYDYRLRGRDIYGQASSVSALRTVP